MDTAIEVLMEQSGVRFGTSGARGLASAITDQVAYAYTKAFLQALGSDLKPNGTVALGGDLRPSTPRIVRAAARAVMDMGQKPINMEAVPSPALALYGISNHCPTVMVTGSHIPDDRNGIKYTTLKGEITKQDETAIKAQVVKIPGELFDSQGMLLSTDFNVPTSDDANEMFRRRFLDVFPAGFLKGKRIGFYEHSAVGRDLLSGIYRDLGAEVVSLGRSDTFVPVDTEAIRPEDSELAREWAQEHNLFAIVSTDGDSDRPLISDENGHWVRGDVSGILTGEFLEAEAAVFPVSCNSAAELSGAFSRTLRTRIGSPFVIHGMEQLTQECSGTIVGYEANGGFLIANDTELFDKVLPALPTRDAVIVHLAVIGTAVRQGVNISDIVKRLPERYTASDRLKNFPQERSAKFLVDLTEDPTPVVDAFGPLADSISPNYTDGIRYTFQSGEVVHFRPSGNAPEFRCYAEADTEGRAIQLVAEGLKFASSL
jgi:phosphomannomutase